MLNLISPFHSTAFVLRTIKGWRKLSRHKTNMSPWNEMLPSCYGFILEVLSFILHKSAKVWNGCVTELLYPPDSNWASNSSSKTYPFNTRLLFISPLTDVFRFGVANYIGLLSEIKGSPYLFLRGDINDNIPCFLLHKTVYKAENDIVSKHETGPTVYIAGYYNGLNLTNDAVLCR